MVLWGSISLAQTLMRANLVDEYHIQICPALVGGGRPLFPEMDQYAKLELIDFKRYDSGMMLLRYRPRT
jgi:dihydrofolate reductase